MYYFPQIYHNLFVKTGHILINTLVPGAASQILKREVKSYELVMLGRLVHVVAVLSSFLREPSLGSPAKDTTAACLPACGAELARCDKRPQVTLTSPALAAGMLALGSTAQPTTSSHHGGL